jgi:hypothetical protein
MNRPILGLARRPFGTTLVVCTLAALLPGCASRDFSDAWATPQSEAVAEGRSLPGLEHGSVQLRGGGGIAGLAGEFTALERVLTDRSGSAGGEGEESPSLPSPPQDAKATDAASTKRLVIYTAQLHVLVPSAKESLAKFLARVEQLGGYMQSRSQHTITVRVPAQTFDSILDETREYGKITHEKIDALDVTRQFRDVTIRLETAEKSRQRLLEILAKAEKVEDVLKIEEQIRRLVTEIELMKAELRNLSDRITFSTITVVFQQNAPEIASPPRLRSRFGWINLVGIEQVLNRF